MPLNEFTFYSPRHLGSFQKINLNSMCSTNNWVRMEKYIFIQVTSLRQLQISG